MQQSIQGRNALERAVEHHCGHCLRTFRAAMGLRDYVSGIEEVHRAMQTTLFFVGFVCLFLKTCATTTTQ